MPWLHNNEFIDTQLVAIKNNTHSVLEYCIIDWLIIQTVEAQNRLNLLW